ncbi:MAG TPA: hypothetical protein VFD63_00430, partial [Pyrinomonadaceae bacterium]|nr:hypothetical protein [Pyrinomonadaceae bacterium]
PIHFPDLLAQRPLILFGKWRGPVSGTIELTGKTGRGDFVSRLDVAGTQPNEDNRALRYLWARNRIAELSDYGAESVGDERVGQITALGLKYNLLTQYTSFIAVREVVTNTLEPAKDVNQPLPLPMRVSDMAVGGGTQNGSEPELMWLLIICSMIGVIIFFNRRRSLV